MCVAVEDAAALLARGAAARRVGETAMNRESSRSHSVFTLTLETRTAGAAGLDKLLHARLNLVDLAGAPMLGFRAFCVHADAEDAHRGRRRPGQVAACAPQPGQPGRRAHPRVQD